MKKRMCAYFFVFTVCVFHLLIPDTVFGQSGHVTQVYKQTLQREDIRVLLPEILDFFKKTEVQAILQPDVIRSILDGPRFLQGLARNTGSEINDQFISLLSIDSELRTLFGDAQFYNVLKDTDEIDALLDFLDKPIPTTLVIVSGDKQHGASNVSLLQPFIVEVHDQHNEVFTEKIEVTFSVKEGGGNLSGQAKVTKKTEMGRAQVTLTLGATGVNQVEASVENFPSLTQTFTAAATSVSGGQDEGSEATTDADVNGDGVVNIIDLSIVLALIGHPDRSIAGVNADINGDKVVNYEDLILILSVLEPAAAAPSIHALVKIGISVADIRALLTQAKALPKAIQADPIYQRGIVGLERLLAILTEVPAVPKQTALLVNYPNPFNPETWIPYQLSEASDVKVSIYAVEGRLIRTLALGHQPAGLYQGKTRAAYWDGRNELGEPVASGVYFYTLTAGDFTATRKMLIRK